MKFSPPLILILICGIMIAALWTGPNLTFDDINYLSYAHEMIGGSFNYAQNPFAYGYLLPATVAASIYALGWMGAAASSIPAMLEYTVLVLLVYYTSLRFANAKVAFAVALIAATSAFIAAYSSRILPDMLAGDIIGLAIYLLVIEAHDNRKVLAAGLITGVLVFVKFGALSIALPIALMLLLGKYKAQAFIYLTGVILIIILYLSTIGFNISVFHTYDAYQISLDQTTLTINTYTSFIFLAPILYIVNAQVYWQVYPIGLLFDFALVGAYIAFLKKERMYTQWAIVLILGFLYLMFGSESLASYIPITIVSRYFILLVIPMAILSARFLNGMYDFLQYRYTPRTATIILGSVVIIAVMVQLPMLYYTHAFIPSYTNAPIAAAANVIK